MTNQFNSRKSAYKIQAEHPFQGGIPAITGKLIAKAELLFGMILGGLGIWTSLMLAVPSWGASVIVGPILSFGTFIYMASLSEATKAWTDLYIIKGIIANEDKDAIAEIIRVNKALAKKIAPYKTVNAMPKELRDDIARSINYQIKTVRHLKELLAEAKASKSYYY